MNNFEFLKKGLANPMESEMKNTTIIFKCIPPNGQKPCSPYDLYLEKQAKLERILTKDEVCAIMDEVNPLANTYTMTVAVLRLDTIVQLAAAGAHGEELLDIVKNFQEDAALHLVHNGHRDLFNPSSNDKLADLSTEE